MNKPANIDAYITGFPEDIQEKLQQLRVAIQKAAPGATEVISYAMPAFKMNSVLVYFAAYKNHIGFYPTASGIAAFTGELAGYKHSKGAIQFPVDQPLPLALITRIVAFRVAMDKVKKTNKQKKGALSK